MQKDDEIRDSIGMPLEAARAVRQQLEGLRRAGLSHWPRRSRGAPDCDAAVIEERVTVPAGRVARDEGNDGEIGAAEFAARAADELAAAVAANSQVEPVEANSTPIAALAAKSLFPEPAPPTNPSPGIHLVPEPSHSPLSNNPTATVSTSDAARSTLPRAEREKQLAAVALRVAACQRCRELAGTRKQTVFGVGNPEASLMFIGEAPGADEDRQGEPFVGRAGQLLTKIIVACQLKREDVYICNILRCRPPENRNPTPDEAKNCREFLDAQIELVDPDYIVCLGTIAAQNLLDQQTPIGRMRGRFWQHGRAKVLCTYHPSYLLRNPSAKKDVWDDMKFLFRDMGIVLQP